VYIIIQGAMDRLVVIANHLSVSEKGSLTPNEVAGTVKSFPVKPDDVVVVAALRTPIGKSRRGYFKVHSTMCFALNY